MMGYNSNSTWYDNTIYIAFFQWSSSDISLEAVSLKMSFKSLENPPGEWALANSHEPRDILIKVFLMLEDKTDITILALSGS